MTLARRGRILAGIPLRLPHWIDGRLELSRQASNDSHQQTARLRTTRRRRRQFRWRGPHLPTRGTLACGLHAAARSRNAQRRLRARSPGIVAESTVTCHALLRCRSRTSTSRQHSCLRESHRSRRLHARMHRHSTLATLRVQTARCHPRQRRHPGREGVDVLHPRQLKSVPAC